MTRVALCAVALLQPGCILLLRGTHQDIAVVSDPPGATVAIESSRVRAPGTLEVRRAWHAKNVVATLGEKRFTGQVTPIEGGSDVFPFVLGLIDALLILPFLVDYGAASLQSYPEEIHVTFPEGGAPYMEVWYVKRR